MSDTQKPLYLVTGSQGKFTEARTLLPGLRCLAIDLPEIQELDSRQIVAAKLEAARRSHPDGDLLVEDTALELKTLGGLPGPFIKWFLAKLGEQGLADLVSRLGSDRAVARTVVGYGTPDGQNRFFEGTTSGRIVSPRGTHGFGWDRIFLPDGSDKTFGEMEPAEKRGFSMRRIAFERFGEFYGHALESR